MLSKYLWSSAFALVGAALAALPVGNPAWAGPPADAFGLFESIPVTPTGSNNTAGGLYSFDISWVDQPGRLLRYHPRPPDVCQRRFHGYLHPEGPHPCG